MKPSKKDFTADRFWDMALERIDNINDSEEDIRWRDLTHIFYVELEHRIKKGELINININGNVRLGKSTMAMQLCSDIKHMIEKHWNIKRPMSNQNVTRDQNEYSRLVKRRSETLKHECDVIDEWAEMELTGLNATIEQKFLKQFSDVQAGRYYHRIACSPTAVTDENSDLLITIVPGSRTKGKTLGLLYYRLNRGNMTEPILLGHIVITVQPTLNAEWYKEYLTKKEEKWELMNKHNVKSPRELEYATIILKTYDMIQEGAKIGLTQRKHIKPFLQAEADKVGVWFSILGDKDILETLEGLAERRHLIYTHTNKLKSKKLQGEQRLSMIKIIHTLQEQLTNALRRQSKLSQLWKEYQLI